MDIYEYMEGYDPTFDVDEFEERLWEAMQEEDFEFTEEFENYCHVYGIHDIHDFLRRVRAKKGRY